MGKDREQATSLSDLINEYTAEIDSSWNQIQYDEDSHYRIYNKLRYDGKERMFWMSEVEKGIPSFIFTKMEIIPTSDQRYKAFRELFLEKLNWNVLVRKISYFVSLNRRFNPTTAALLKQYAPYLREHQNDMTYLPTSVYSTQAQAFVLPSVRNF